MIISSLLPETNSEDILTAMYPVMRKTGIPAKMVEDTVRYTNISMNDMIGLLSVSGRTWQRYKKQGFLGKDVSDRFLALIQIFAYGEQVFGNFNSFKKWLHAELPVLGSTKPQELLSSFSGILIVKELLGHIEYGEFS